jgi:hypothetical protein
MVILLLFFLFNLIARIIIINNIIKYGTTERMEIVYSVNWPRDQYVCYFNYYGENIKTVLKVSKKNRSMLNEYCKKGNKIPVRYLNNKKNIVLADI